MDLLCVRSRFLSLHQFSTQNQVPDQIGSSLESLDLISWIQQWHKVIKVRPLNVKTT